MYKITDEVEMVFKDSPVLRKALDHSNENLIEFNAIASSLIGKIQSTCQLATELNSEYLSIVREISRLKTFYRLEQASFGERSSNECYVIDDKKIEQVQAFVSNLSSLAQFLVDYQSVQENIINQVKGNVLDPLVDFQNKLDFTNKKLRKNYEKNLNSFENSLSKFLALSKKKDKSDLANNVVESKTDFIVSTETYLSNVNYINEVREDFFTEKILQIVRIFSDGGFKKLWADEFLRYAEGSRRELLTIINLPILDEKEVASEYKDQLNNFETKLKTSGCKVSDKDIEINKTGYLMKRGKNPVNKIWSRRYYWIEDGELRTLNRKSSVHNYFECVVKLQNCVCKEVDLDDRSWVFEICDAGNNSFYFQAENEEEFMEWLNVVNTINATTMARLKKESNRIESYNTALEDTKSETSYTSFDEIMVDVLCSGLVAVKEVKITTENDIGGQINDYNVFWRTCKLELLTNGKLYQIVKVQGKKQSSELLDFTAKVSNRYQIQAADESLFSRKHVISINTIDGRILYLAANTFKEFNSWLFYLKSKAQGFVPGADGALFRANRNLYIRVVEGRNFGINLDPYCEIYFGAIKKAQTNVRFKTNGEPFWREEFSFGDIHSLRQGVTVIVMNKSRQGKDNEIGRICLKGISIKLGDNENWFPIMLNDKYITNPNSAIAELKLKIKFEEEIILSIDQYEELQKIFTVSCPIVYDLAQVSSDLEFISSILLLIYEARSCSIDWLLFLLKQEISSTDRTAVLFRGNSLLTKAMDYYMRLHCTEYLEYTLCDILKDICENPLNCEIDPTRLESKDDLANNLKNLQTYAKLIWKRIKSSGLKLPIEVKYLITKLKEFVLEKFNSRENEKVQYTAITGFLFLRLIVPAVLNPKLFHLYKDFPEGTTSRTLTLLAKTIQCLGNLASFGIKENYMLDMNEFLMDHSVELIDFIESISHEVNYPRSCEYKVDLEKQYGILHRFVRNNMKGLRDLAQNYKNSAKIAKSTPEAESNMLTVFIRINDGTPLHEQYLRRSKDIEGLLTVSDTIEELIHKKLVS